MCDKVVCEEEEEGGGGRRGGDEDGGCRSKDKNPTQFCGEQTDRRANPNKGPPNGPPPLKAVGHDAAAEAEASYLSTSAVTCISLARCPQTKGPRPSSPQTKVQNIRH